MSTRASRVSSCLVLLLGVQLAACSPEGSGPVQDPASPKTTSSAALDRGAGPRSDAASEETANDGPLSYAALYAEVESGGKDPLTVPFDNGIVWYGTWEDAMAEKERTGKPIMLHFGSPRCPSENVCVPGTW